MGQYAVHFEWSEAVEARTLPRYELDGATLAIAKLQAAVLYADANFGTPPSGYRIVQHGEVEVYCYPEGQSLL